ncbi:hypothetical protein AAHB37_11600 [Glutamicibacter halophytocola]
MSESFMDATLTPKLVSEYYSQIATEDVAAYRPDELESRVAAHLEIGYEREAESPNVAITRNNGISVVHIVTDDMPFLVDSVTAALVRLNSPIQLVVHPTFVVSRKAETGEIVKISHAGLQHVASGDTAALSDLSTLISAGTETHVESWISVELARELSDEQAEEFVERLYSVLGDVRIAVKDWPSMLDRAKDIARTLPQTAHAEQIAELPQAAELLDWMADGQFTFLGYREYDLESVNGEDVLVARAGSRPGTHARLGNAGATAPDQARSHYRSRQERTDHHQGQRPLNGAPWRVLGLRRRQEL